jgi:hypothetical protein
MRRFPRVPRLSPDTRLASARRLRMGSAISGHIAGRGNTVGQSGQGIAFFKECDGWGHNVFPLQPAASSEQFINSFADVPSDHRRLPDGAAADCRSTSAAARVRSGSRIAADRVAKRKVAGSATIDHGTAR